MLVWEPTVVFRGSWKMHREILCVGVWPRTGTVQIQYRYGMEWDLQYRTFEVTNRLKRTWLHWNSGWVKHNCGAIDNLLCMRKQPATWCVSTILVVLLCETWCRMHGDEPNFGGWWVILVTCNPRRLRNGRKFLFFHYLHPYKDSRGVACLRRNDPSLDKAKGPLDILMFDLTWTLMCVY